MKTLLLPILALLLCAASALAQTPDGDLERHSLDQRRAALDAQLAKDEQGCAGHFAVTDCVDKARQRHSAAIRPLVERGQALDAAAIAARARAKATLVRQRQQQAAIEQADRTGSAVLRASEPHGTRAAPRPQPLRASPAARAQAQRDREAAADKQAAEQREHQAKVLADLKERQQEARVQAAKRIQSKRKPGIELVAPTAQELAGIKAAASAASK